MDSDAVSELSEVSAATSIKSKKSRFRTGKKNKDHSNSSRDLHSAFGVKKSRSSSLKQMKEMSDFDINASSALDKEDPVLRFSGEGVTFKAKLIGVDPVTSPRGDQMCKNAMTRLKAIVKGTGSHKQKIILSISLDGLKLMDEKTKEVISQHPIPLISYISRDTSDTRAFGFVYGSPSEGHQFIGIKTEKQAIPVMQSIADLFTFVYEKRKQEKSSKEEASSPRSQSNVLTFDPKEEVFSTDKVNAAWSRSDPSKSLSQSSTSILRRNPSSPASNSILPPLLPPPRTESVSSRASTLNSSQKSDVLSELRTMRHVINSAQAASMTSKDNDRYATWESFNEAEANETLTQINSLNSNSHTLGVYPSLDSIRPPSARSTTETTSNHSTSIGFIGGGSGRGIGPHMPSSVMPVLVPSPPSSPRTNGTRGRGRLRQGFVQPNQVALPPPTSSVGSSSLSLQSSVSPALIARSTAMTGVQRTDSISSSYSNPPLNSFPAQSEPDLLSQFNRSNNSSINRTNNFISTGTSSSPAATHSNFESNKFEVNFDAVFSTPGSIPSVPPAPPLIPPNTGNKQPDMTSGDRYACFQEIQNLASYPSIFDNPSSSSDSDTFVGSTTPSLISPAKTTTGGGGTSDKMGASQSQDLFGGDISWSQPASQPVLMSYPPLIPAPDESRGATSTHFMNGQDVKKRETSSERKPQEVNRQTEVTKSSPKFVDSATSPGTPPGTISSHQQSNHSQSKANNESFKDPFAMTAMFKDLESSTSEGKDMRSNRNQFSDEFGRMAEAETTASSSTGVLTNRVCDSQLNRPPSAASSVASSSSQSVNPFSREDTSRSDFEDSYSCRPSMSSTAYPKPAVTGYGEYFDPFLFQRSFNPSVAAFDAASFARTGPPGFLSWHPHHAMNPMPPPCSHPQMPNCQCQGYYCGPDVRFHPMYHQFHAMYSSHQQKKHPPTDFGPSFDFGSDFDSRFFQHNSSRGGEDDALSARSLSPNNPFSPVFPRETGQESPSPSLPPPRPPARVEQRRMSTDSDPPPIPKRKPLQPAMMHYYPYHAPQGQYALPPGIPRQGYMSYSPPVMMTDTPPLPLPSRKKPASFSASNKTTSVSAPGPQPGVERRVSFEAKVIRAVPVEDPFDPFNVTYVDKKLSELSSSQKKKEASASMMELTTMEKKGFPDQTNISTPLNSTVDPHVIQPRPGDLNFSTISSGTESLGGGVGNISQTSDSVFDVTEKVSSNQETQGYMRLEEEKRVADQLKKQQTSLIQLESQQQNISSEKELTTTSLATTGTVPTSVPFNHFGQDHISPPERNIFRPKDPFADDEFFSETS